MVKIKKSIKIIKVILYNELKNIIFFRDFAHKLSLALISNANTILQTIDLSYNTIEDKGKYYI